MNEGKIGWTPPRHGFTADDSMDTLPSPRPLHLDDESYQDAQAAGFEDSRAAGTKLFQTGTNLNSHGYTDFSFLMGKDSIMSKEPSTAGSAAPSTVGDDNDSTMASASVDQGRKRFRTVTDGSMEDIAFGPPCPPARPHKVPFGVVEGEDRGPNAMNPPIFRVDPYFWMRDQKHENEEVQKLLRDEDMYCKQSLSHLQIARDRLYAEMMGHTKEADIDIPAPHVDGYAYYSRSFKGKAYRAHYRAKIVAGMGCLPGKTSSASQPVAADAKVLSSLVGMDIMDEELLLDENDLHVNTEDGSERPYLSVKGPRLSYDNEAMAYAEDFEGNDCYTMTIRPFCGACEFKDCLKNTEGSAEWDAMGHKGIYYLGLDEEFRAGTLCRHIVGTDRKSVV